MTSFHISLPGFRAPDSLDQISRRVMDLLARLTSLKMPEGLMGSIEESSNFVFAFQRPVHTIRLVVHNPFQIY